MVIGGVGVTVNGSKDIPVEVGIAIDLIVRNMPGHKAGSITENQVGMLQLGLE